ncbi:hypothetical protein [Streptomyces sp. LS1784]|uniref:hypothetical protein n=1 Tax=Streptomyces sp. LS1784 TaxID=2851533 RepID=UPI001CCB1891|nr:hypothetical protein [Streptomyces sp. LS1784]
MANKDVELGRATAMVAERVVAELTSANRVLQSVGLGDLPDHAINGGALVSYLPPGVLSVSEVRQMTTLAALWRLWAKGKNVAAMHPDMASELATYRTGKLPGQLFRNLARHPNLMVAFAEPPTVELVAGDGGKGRLLVMLFSGRRTPDKLLCLTSDHRMDEIVVVVICEPIAEDGTPLPPPPGGTTPVLEFCHLSIPARMGDEFTVEDLALRIARKSGREEPTDAQRAIVTRALQVAVYLCSSKADIAAPPAPRGKAAKPGKQWRWNKPDTFLRLGWRLGPRLKAARVRAQEARRSAARSTGGSGAAGGWRQYTHLRSGHLKTVWYGPGKKLSDSRLIEPYWVSEDLLDEDGQAPEGIIRPVR